MRSVLLRQAEYHKSALGYAHTWFDATGVDMKTLATYPSDQDIRNIAIKAYGAAENIFSFLDVYPSLLQHHHLPSIDHLFSGISDLDIDSRSDQELMTSSQLVPSFES